MNLQVKHFRNVTDATITLPVGVTLISGGNGQGKSSLLHAAAACANVDAAMLPGGTKKDSGCMVQDNEPKGEVSLDGRTVKFPFAVVGPAPFAKPPSLMALGRVDWNAMDGKEKLKELMRIAPGATITRKDIKDALAGVDKSYVDAAIALADLDKVYALAQKSMTEYTGAWKQITGQAFGSVKAESYEPYGWTPDLTHATLATLLSDLHIARQKLNQGVVDQAVAGHDLLAQKELAERELPDVAALEEKHQKITDGDFEIYVTEKDGTERALVQKEEVKALKKTILDQNVIPEDQKAVRAKVANIKRKLDELRVHHASINQNKPQDTTLCPWCEKPVVICGGAVSKPRDVNADDQKLMADAIAHQGQLLKKELEGLEMTVIAWDQDLKRTKENAQSSLQRLETEKSRMSQQSYVDLSNAKQFAEQIMAARDAIIKNQGKTVTPEQLDALRKSVTLAELNQKAYQQKTQADEAFYSWLEWQKVRDVASPDGIRKTKMESAIGGINAILSGICTLARWSNVTINNSGDLFFGGRPYFLLSESEKYRCWVAIQMMFAASDKDEMVIFDGADILDPKGRNGLLKVCSEMGVIVLVGMTGKEEQVKGLNVYVKQIVMMENGVARVVNA